MKKLFAFSLSLFLSTLYAQTSDTLNGYSRKIQGEEINYFSPMQQFAPRALLTRMNGEMPIGWESPLYKGNATMVTYRLLLGHSTGTSNAERHFDCMLNGEYLFTIHTPMHQKGNYELKGDGEKGSGWHFEHLEYDVNNDAFGMLYITIPATLVNQAARFTINGKNENSRDWLMVFMYNPGLKVKVQPTALVTRKDNRRQLNLFLDNPFPGGSSLKATYTGGVFETTLQYGYNKISFPAWQANITGRDSVVLVVNKSDTLYETVILLPIKPYTFSIIHHSHNDIGYSHLQPEVEQIQNNNIHAALRWIDLHKHHAVKPFWHIESLWAVENFLRVATKEEEQRFVAAVKSGHLVLSANYANVLTGLCQPAEAEWMTEYARVLEKKYGFRIRNAMITDIPGISRAGLLGYVKQHIPYLSLGPNYVENFPDRGDRVGGVINEQGDKIFYWKPHRSSKQKLLVWTAGKGYSFFHGIGESVKKESWEKRISGYINELVEKKYPYDMVQLRYSKNADNGPVDTLLTVFVQQWNDRYSSPVLQLSSVDSLFNTFEKKYKGQIPVYTGEISPYWEDGAYSTAKEEMEARMLVQKTLALKKQLYSKPVSKARHNELQEKFYPLHRNLVLFHEHTWGAWCSISDPESAFTQKQWEIKKGFLDSARHYYHQLAKEFSNPQQNKETRNNFLLAITDYTVDDKHGGIKSLIVNGKNLVAQDRRQFLFEPIYAAGINPMQMQQATVVSVLQKQNNGGAKITEVSFLLPTLEKAVITYTLHKKAKKLSCKYEFNKKPVITKESLHIALPFSLTAPLLHYGSPGNMQTWGKDQLAGSNREFICVENQVLLESKDIEVTISSPAIALYETGSIINEDLKNGIKEWNPTNKNPLPLYLYVFNNYWHTNYKASQDGHFVFDIEISFRQKRM